MESIDMQQKPLKSRQPLSRTRTIDGSFPSSFRRPSKTEESKQQKKKDTVKKHVQFKDDSTIVYHTINAVGFDEDAGELKDYYVLPDELKEIKKQGVLACKEVRRSGLATLLTEIYGTANDKDTQNRLNYWCRMASECRGLERYANEEMSKRRNVYRKRAIVSVLEAQQQLKNEEGIDIANVLRRLSEAYTEQARLFAEKIGMADYHALQLHPATQQAQAKAEAAAAVNAAMNGGNTDGMAIKTADGRTTPPNVRMSRKNRAQRMQQRAAKTAAAAAAAGQEEISGTPFRRNNTTMTSVVLQHSNN